MLKDAREGFSADPKPTPNHKAIFPKHCTPKPAQKPLAAPKSCHKPSKSLQNHLSNICREFGQNWNRKPPNSGWLEIALALRFFYVFFHFSRTCFAHPFWKEFTGTLFLGLLVFRVPVFPLLQALALTRIHSLPEQF